MRSLALVAALSLAAAAQGAPRQFGVPALPRADFNRLAVLARLPLFWTEDKNGNQLIDADEVAVVGAGATLAPYVVKGKLTPLFAREYQALVERRRREAVQRELDGGYPTLVASDLTALPHPQKAFVKEMLAAAQTIEDLYLHQTGGYQYARAAARLDPASRSLVWRNHGPWCETPGTKEDPFCSGSPRFPEKLSEAYPMDAPQDAAMCAKLQAQPNARELLDPFTVVRRRGATLAAVPLTQALGREMRAVAARLKAAAAAVAKDPAEQALQRYLVAAARAFETNDWAAADEAWAAMSPENSAWYLRVAPDEVYFDPCQQKAGFALTLARIDQSSLTWKKKLTPLRTDMEQSLARLIGKPYRAREVKFHLPDFIHIVLNSGDARHPLGATVGQSLPNWGKVVQEGRGRTVVMSNLYTDPDSKRLSRERAERLLSRESMTYYTDDAEPALLGIILHEATHNFGPFSDYRINGKPAKEVFGGQLASTLEELKAEVGGAWFLQLLRRRGLITERQLRQAYTAIVTWAFGHISRGMFTTSGNVQPYSQLAAVMVGSFVADGALTFRDGRFTVHFEHLPGAIERLTRTVGRIKATGDVAAGRQLVDHFVKGKGHPLVHEEHIAKELLRFPKTTFLYSVRY